MKVVLKLKKELNKILDLRSLSNLNGKPISLKELCKIKFLYGRRIVAFEDIFSFKLLEDKKIKNEIYINSSSKYFHYLGYKWTEDKIIVQGEVGSYLGFGMISGDIEINGNSGDFLGSEMTGGKIIVYKDAGNFVGSSFLGNKIGMNGGEILIHGNAGKYLANFMRRGIIIVKGNVDNYCCFNMIAGSVVICKRIAMPFGAMMKRGSLIIKKNQNTIGPNFKKCEAYDLVFLKVFCNYLKRKYGINLDSETLPDRYVGDCNNSGLAEVLILN